MLPYARTTKRLARELRKNQTGAEESVGIVGFESDSV